MTGGRRKVLLTGAGGFIGRNLLRRLVDVPKVSVRAASRRENPGWPSPVEGLRTEGLGATTDWQQAVSGVDVVVHAAARVHVVDESDAEPMAAFRRVNVDGTLQLARQAAQAGVRRFVFISSIKVNGEQSPADRGFRYDDLPAPADPYGQSKLEAEQGLADLSRRTGLEVVIVRPPLVYGPGVKANFERLMRLVQRGIPLPLGAVPNRRSMVALDNLVDLLVRCVDAPEAAGNTFLVSDGRDLSTPELVRLIAGAMGRPARLVPVPVWLLRKAGTLAGKSAEVDRLCGSLRVDDTFTRETLNWQPPVTVEEGVRRTVDAFR